MSEDWSVVEKKKKAPSNHRRDNNNNRKSKENPRNRGPRSADKRKNIAPSPKPTSNSQLQQAPQVTSISMSDPNSQSIHGLNRSKTGSAQTTQSNNNQKIQPKNASSPQSTQPKNSDNLSSQLNNNQNLQPKNTGSSSAKDEQQTNKDKQHPAKASSWSALFPQNKQSNSTPLLSESPLTTNPLPPLNSSPTTPLSFSSLVSKPTSITDKEAFGSIKNPISLQDGLHKYYNGELEQFQSQPIVRLPLRNGGNFCFINSTLQVIFSVPRFRRFLRSLQDVQWSDSSFALKRMIKFLQIHETQHNNQNPKANSTKATLTNYLPQVAVTPTDAYYFAFVMKKFNPKKYQNLVNEHVQQEDVEEFYTFLLETLSEELRTEFKKHNIDLTTTSNRPVVEDEDDPGNWEEVSKNNKTNHLITKRQDYFETPITEIFRGTLRSCLKHSAKGSVSIQPFYCVPLDIFHSSVNDIETALSAFLSSEHVQLSSNESSKKMTTFDLLPPILTFHLKRFHFSTATGEIHKIKKFVSFPPSFSIKRAWLSTSEMYVSPADSWSTKVDLKEAIPKYRLWAVICHSGESAHSGHYTCDVKLDPSHSRSSSLSAHNLPAWLHFNDSQVSKRSEQEVLLQQNAYLLFYERFD